MCYNDLNNSCGDNKMKVVVLGCRASNLVNLLNDMGFDASQPMQEQQPILPEINYAPTRFYVDHKQSHPNDNWRGKSKRSLRKHR